MKWLMCMPVMDDEPGIGGGGAPADGVNNDPIAKDSGVGNNDGAGDDEGANPLLAKPKEGEETKKDNAAEPQNEYADDAYAEIIKADEGAGYSFDGDIIKAMTPAFKSAKLSPEQSNTLANEYAKVQMAQQKAEIEARQARIAAWKPRMEQMVKDNPRLIDEANAAINHYCKNNPALEHVIRYTELGSDPDFVQLMADRGREILADTGVGRNAAKGGGNMTFSQAMA